MKRTNLAILTILFLLIPGLIQGQESPPRDTVVIEAGKPLIPHIESDEIFTALSKGPITIVASSSDSSIVRPLEAGRYEAVKPGEAILRLTWRGREITTILARVVPPKEE